MKIRKLFVLSALLPCIGGNVYATTYQLPVNSTDAIVTQYPSGMAIDRAEKEETLLDVALRHLLGQNEIVRLNQKLDRWEIKKGELVKLANRRILPDSPHKGITLNISEFRMYYYPASQPGTVMSYAHGVGRQDWKTPLGETKIVRKVKDPSWHPPESIRKEHAANGDPLPEVVLPGPHNPLGAHALYLNLPGEYRIHGTDIDKIFGIGMQITHGCVRMYPDDIAELYNNVEVGTPVFLVKQPIKVGWLDNTLYIEAHPDLQGEEISDGQRHEDAFKLIQKATKQEMPEIDQKALSTALKELTGDPVAIYEGVPPSLEVATPDVVPPVEGIPVIEEIPEPKALSVPSPAPVRRGSKDGYYHGN
jgi:L,D-transpeptidase ErfK/SrfK